MKRLIALLLSALLLVGMTGCGGSGSSKKSSKQYNRKVTAYLLVEGYAAYSGVVEKYEYDEYGNVVWESRYEERTYDNEYDDDGRLLRKICYIDGQEHYTVEYEYDNAGRLIQVFTDYRDYEPQTVRYEYDENGHFAAKLWVYGEESDGIHYECDKNGNIVLVSIDDFMECEFEYDENGNKILETETRYDSGEKDVEVTTYEYDDDGNRILERGPYGYDGNTYRIEYEYTDDGCTAVYYRPDGTTEKYTYVKREIYMSQVMEMLYDYEVDKYFPMIGFFVQG